MPFDSPGSGLVFTVPGGVEYTDTLLRNGRGTVACGSTSRGCLRSRHAYHPQRSVRRATCHPYSHLFGTLDCTGDDCLSSDSTICLNLSSPSLSSSFAKIFPNWDKSIQERSSNPRDPKKIQVLGLDCDQKWLASFSVSICLLLCRTEARDRDISISITVGEVCAWRWRRKTGGSAGYMIKSSWVILAKRGQKRVIKSRFKDFRL